MNPTPPIVKEFKNATLIERGGIGASAGWRKPFRLFTLVTSAFVGIWAMSSFGEKDKYGREHVFSNFYRWRVKLRDELFGVKKKEEEILLKLKSEDNNNNNNKLKSENDNNNLQS